MSCICHLLYACYMLGPVLGTRQSGAEAWLARKDPGQKLNVREGHCAGRSRWDAGQRPSPTWLVEAG